MNNKQFAAIRQQSLYSGEFIGLGIGVILTTLFWYLIAPTNLVVASLVTGGIIMAFGIGLHLIPAENSAPADESKVDIDIDEFVKEWPSQEHVGQYEDEFDNTLAVPSAEHQVPV